MRLALNFQRIDPSRGGAETYVVDLASVDFTTPARLQDLQWTGDFTPVAV